MIFEAVERMAINCKHGGRSSMLMHGTPEAPTLQQILLNTSATTQMKTNTTFTN
jgi:hypothetical protein